MQEALLHYIWKNALLDKTVYRADSGEHIRIIHYGVHNTDAGPDFMEARIEIEGTLWVGNVEIHQLASDWYRHNHHTDSAYNNVILHVVWQNDKPCCTAGGRPVPGIQIRPDTRLSKKYQQLMENGNKIPCARDLNSLDPSRVLFWLSRLTIERLNTKTEAIRELLSGTRNNWEESFYIHLSRSFGLKLNALPFEWLARSLPLKIIQQQAGHLMRIESLLFGQAGFLNEEEGDDYYLALRDEYSFQASKFALKPIEKHLWKFLRTRPLNFPTLRIAQLSSLLSSVKSTFSLFLEFDEPLQFVNYFSCDVSEYWKNHYTFGSTSVPGSKKPGKQLLYSLLINTLVPFMYVYGDHKNNNRLKEQAISWLEQIPAERNQYTKAWEEFGIIAAHAADSQALFELTNKYCSIKKCLNCQIGYQILNFKKK